MMEVLAEEDRTVIQMWVRRVLTPAPSTVAAEATEAVVALVAYLLLKM